MHRSFLIGKMAQGIYINTMARMDSISDQSLVLERLISKFTGSTNKEKELLGEIKKQCGEVNAQLK